MADDKKKAPKNIDELVDSFGKENYKNIADAFKAYDKFAHEDKENETFNNIINPAFNAMYDTFTSTIGTDHDNTKIKDVVKDKDKKSKYRKATIESLKKFFEKARPSVLKAIKDIKDEEDIYKTLVGQYDIIVGTEDGKGLSALLNAVERDEKYTIGRLKRDLAQIRGEHGANMYNTLMSQYIGTHFSKYQPHEVGSHLKETLIEKKGYKVQDYHKLLNKKSVHEYFPLREGLIKGEFAKGTNLETQYGIVHKKEEEKPK